MDETKNYYVSAIEMGTYKPKLSVRDFLSQLFVTNNWTYLQQSHYDNYNLLGLIGNGSSE